MELGSIIGENNSQSASRPKKFLITVMLGLDPSIQVNNKAAYLTWILRSSRRMTERGAVKPENDKRGEKSSLKAEA